ncbi:low affinity immunoglobulin gamma Fc region receptor III-A-like isoform X2 [Epinephelus lanceolatus]
MEVTALCFRLLMLGFILLNGDTEKSDAAFLRITPDRLQHFKYESVSFDCEGPGGSTKLRMIRNTEEFDPACHISQTSSGSFCTIRRVYPSDSGEYWCETEGGERSNSVNISVTAGSVILESPVLPVMKGDAVTLHCKNKKMSTNPSAGFYKDGLLIRSSSTGEMTIHNVSKSDEGLYKCHISGAGESPESWMAVRAPHQGTLSDDSNVPHVPILLWIAITILILALVLVVVGFLYIRKHRVSSKTPTAASRAVKDNQKFNGEDAADDLDGVTYAVVFTKSRQHKDAADAADNLSLGSNHTRKPRAEKHKDESSFQSVYSTLTISQTPKALQHESTVSRHPTAAKDSNSNKEELLYAPVQKATKTRDT